MLPSVLRKAVNAFSKETQFQPDYYFVEGFLIGKVVINDIAEIHEWLLELFGEYTSIYRVQLEALMNLHEQCVSSLDGKTYKLPKECALSKQDFAASLAQGAPLPNFCLGLLKALDKVSIEYLSEVQKDAVTELQKQLTGFTSLDAAKAAFSHAEPMMTFEREARDVKRYLAGAIVELADTLMWDPELDNEFGGFELDEEFDEEQEEIRSSLIEHLLSLSHIDSIPLLDQFIYNEEQDFITPDYIEENQENFWLIHETRPYMAVRQRKAWIYFWADRVQEAVDELEVLLRLNPNDNQACRYLYVNGLVILKQWDKLQACLNEYEEDSIFMLSAEALMHFALHGESKALDELKATLKGYNKHFIKMLTGQEKIKPKEVYGYSLGSKEEVLTYIENGGKKAWLSVEGSLFWLRKKK
ncbi:hypothetical protein [Pseudoalteromonas piscicida]|uniref:hypothetical protein n=1 Tax=Pseudoalteromonas piscicida TaxID=43662 RepID=UPI0030A392C5